MVKRWFSIVMVSLLMACGGGSKEASPDASLSGDADAATPGADAGSDNHPALDGFFDRAAGAICGALYRCCDGSNIEDYFAPHRNNDLLEPFWSRLPPNATMTQSQCEDTVAEMLAVTPFGDWVAHAQTGLVEFRPQVFNSCVQALEQAECGEEARAALFDSACLGFSSPLGGEAQRTIFARSGAVGQACAPIRDGVGAAFYGTCDPSAAFCCYTDPSNPELGCTYPFEGETGAPREGVCTAAAATGSSCQSIPPLGLCKTGLDCDYDTGTCIEQLDTPLAVGDACMDDSFNNLGSCQDSFCDSLGSKLCEALKADESACTAGYECLSGYCRDQICSVNDYCVAPGMPGDADAGTTDPDAGTMADAGVPSADAGGPATGETCGDALDLMASSTAASSTQYDYQVTSTFGASNDYNPLDTSGLAPGCSFVYDAIGNDRVYAVTLEPGETLSMRLAVEPNSAPGGLYLLDDCDAGSWPDFDGSGACGSNEYKSQGYCGALGCDPLELAITYPDEIGGVPTASKTFWVVVDEVGGAAATGFTLEWKTIAP